MYLLQNKMELGIMILVILLPSVQGHAYLDEPPSRNALWRHGYKVPINYNDNEQNCGGFNRQQRNGGKCGVCGDAYDMVAPPHVHPNRYATKNIPRVYKQGQVIDVKVKVTANHKGYFTFKIGALNVRPINEKDLIYKLKVVSGSTLLDAYTVPPGNNLFSLKVKLPDKLICNHCVFQWTYTAGNNWGCNGPDKCGLGFGPQETFVNCADIRIVSSDGSGGSVNPTTATVGKVTSTASTGTISTAAPVVTTQTVCKARSSIFQIDKETADRWCHNNCKRNNYCPPAYCYCYSKTGPVPVIPKTTCIGAGAYFGVREIAEWCTINCAVGFCPESHCICASNREIVCDAGIFRNIEEANKLCQSLCDKGDCDNDFCKCTLKLKPKCVATGAFKDVSGMTEWCQKNCPGESCLPTHCDCS